MNDKSIRVWAVFSTYYPNFSGTAIQGHQIMRVLASRGFRFEILTAANNEAASLAGQKIRQDGIPIRYVPVIRHYHWLQRVFIPIPYLRKLIYLINSLLTDLSFNVMVAWIIWREAERGEIIHFHSLNETSFLVSWVAQALGVRAVILLTLLGSDDPQSISNFGHPILKRLKLKAFASADVIITLCTALTESCRLAGIAMDKVVQIPCAVDTKIFHPLPDWAAKKQLRRELKLNADSRSIVFAGSATLRKGIDVVVESFIDVAQKNEDVDLVIVGPSDFRDYARYSPTLQRTVTQITEILAGFGLGERVHWVGRVEDVYKYLQVADIFCFPTRREGFGIVIAEAMVTGLPVVVSRLSGVTTDHISSQEEGTLIEGYTPSEYANALLYLLEHPSQAQKMGQAARETALSRFDLGLISEQYAHLYENLSELSPLSVFKLEY